MRVCRIDDPGALIDALAELGFGPDRLEVHAQPQPLYNYNGADTGQQANVIIRRHHLDRLSNDVGWAWKDGECEVVVSEFDRQIGYDQAWIDRVTNLAAVHKAIDTARSQGHLVERRTDDRGRIQLVVSGMR